MSADDAVGVFHANQSTRKNSVPEFRVSRDQAREWVNSFLAKWINKAKDIQMNHTMAAMNRPSQSLTMGPRVSELAADGNPYFTALVEAYRPADRAA